MTYGTYPEDDSHAQEFLDYFVDHPSEWLHLDEYPERWTLHCIDKFDNRRFYGT